MNRPITNRPEETGISLTPGFSRVPPHQRLGGRHRLISTRLQPGEIGQRERENRFNGFPEARDPVAIPIRSYAISFLHSLLAAYGLGDVGPSPAPVEANGGKTFRLPDELRV